MKIQQLIKLFFVTTVVTIGSTKTIDRPILALEKEQNVSLEIVANDSANTENLNAFKTDVNPQNEFPVDTDNLLKLMVLIVITGLTAKYLKPLKVRIDPDKVGIVYKKFGKSLPSNLQIAVNGEMGYQVDTLDPGRYYFLKFWMYKISTEKAVKINIDEIGIVSANDGASLPPGKMFGDVVECNDFQDGRQFIVGGGQRGKQLAILKNGTYRINPKLFKVTKSKITYIGENEIGIISANEGASLPPGKMFGDVVECNDFQDGGQFIVRGGQRGQQLAILRNGTYGINPELFKVTKSKITYISEGEIGLVEAKDGQPLPSGKMFGDPVECSNFEDARSFIVNGGYRGKQLRVLTTGKYAINTELFKIKKIVPILIKANEVGLVEAEEGQSLPLGENFGRVVECNDFQDAEAFINNGGQRGLQLAILPPGSYDINTELFKVFRVPVVDIPSGEIGLIVAKSGASKESGQILSKTVDCNKFQDAEAFIKNGGQKGQQRAILGSGTYRINTDLFTVITSKNAKQHGIKPEQLKTCKVGSDKIGIVTTTDGKPLSNGNIAAPIIEGHNKFQDPEKFIDLGGYRGLQEEILEEGSWKLNPWFAKVEEVPLTSIKAGTVGVVISNIGKNVEQNEDLTDSKSEDSKSEFNLVPKGYKGIEKSPLEAGKYPINTRVKTIVIVPTHEITLKWTNNTQEVTGYDSDLKTLELHSKDGFIFKLEVTQVINITSENAPKMISRVGSATPNIFNRVGEQLGFGELTSDKAVKYSSIQNLVSRVLEPMVGNYFRNAAQDFEALDFLQQREQIQQGATEHIKNALQAYGVQAGDTLINEIDLPDELEEPIKQQKIDEIETEQLITQQKKEQVKQELITQQAINQSQPELIQAQQNTEIARENARIQEMETQLTINARKQENDENLRIEQKQNQMKLDLQEEASKIEINKQQKFSQIRIEEKERLSQIEMERETRRAQIEMELETRKAEIEQELAKLQTKLKIEDFKEILKALSPELYTKIETEKMWAEAFSQFKFTAPQTVVTGGGGNNSSPVDALYKGEFQTSVLEMFQNRFSNRQSNNLPTNKLNMDSLKDTSPEQLLEGGNNSNSQNGQTN